MAGPTLSTHVGPVYNGDGVGAFDKRLDSHMATVVTEAGGKYKEACKRGNVYSATTAATGTAPGTALGTTAAFTLYNPAGSGKNLIVQKAGLGLISGTMGGGTLWITGSAVGDAAPSGGTAITPRNRSVGSPNTAVGQAFTGATVATTAAKMIDILATITEEVVATTAGPTEVTEKDIDGEIVIQPGFYICFSATAAAGSSPLMVFKATWEEEGITS